MIVFFFFFFFFFGGGGGGRKINKIDSKTKFAVFYQVIFLFMYTLLVGLFVVLLLPLHNYFYTFVTFCSLLYLQR